VREDGGVALLPARDGDVVARGVIVKNNILNAAQFLWKRNAKRMNAKRMNGPK
jgi:hypothetical protein